MSTVFIHAGMPKTGSSSVQEWLRRNAATLRASHGLTTIVDHGPFDDTSGFVAYDRGPFVVSNRFLLAYRASGQQQADQAAIDTLCGQLADDLRDAADTHGDVILTAEAFGNTLFNTEEPVLRAFEAVAQHHEVRVISYVRPQHDALESLWRQWGYHTAAVPSAWFTDRMAELHYHRAIRETAAVAPTVSFELRPFRRDLLSDGDVVVDFARHLDRGTDLAAPHDLDENPGLSLDLAILLRGAPAETLKTPPHLLVDGRETGIRQVSLAAVTKDWSIPLSPRARAVRAAIHSIAYDEFAADNEALVDTQGWATDAFVPKPDGSGVAVHDLDDLLEPDGDPATRAHLHRAIADLCTTHESRRRR